MKKRFFAGFLCLVMLTSMLAGITAGAVSSDDFSNETYFEKLGGVTDFEEGTAGNIILGWWASKEDVPDVYGQEADENLYAKVYSVDGEAANGDDVYIYPTGKKGGGFTLSGKKDYVYEFKLKSNNPNGTTLNPKISFGAALSNSTDSTQATNIHTSFGGTNKFNAGDNVAEQLYFADYTTWQFGEVWDVFPFENNTWYTVRLYVGLNSLNSYVEVLGADGTQLYKSKTVDVNRGSTTGYTYDTIKFNEFRIDFPAGTTEQEKAALTDLEIGFDDIAVYARKAWPVTVETTGNGTVEYNGNPVTTGSEFAVATGEDAVFTVTPSEGYTASATIDGEACEITNNTVTVEDVDSAKALAVTFEKIKINPSITANTTYYTTSSNMVTWEDGTAEKNIMAWWGNADKVPDVYGQDADGNLYAKVYSKAGEGLSDGPYIYPQGKTSGWLELSGKKDYVYEYKFKANNPNGSTLKPQFKYSVSLTNSQNSSQSTSVMVTLGNKEFVAGDSTTDQLYYADLNADVSGWSDAVVKVWDTFPFRNNEWYTIRQYIGLNSLTGHMEIYSSDGEQLFKSETININNEATAGNIYDTIKIQWFNVIFPTGSTAEEKAALTGYEFGFDDMVVCEQIAYPVTVEYDNAKGSVTYNGNSVVSGDTFAVSANENAAFTVTPESGYSAKVTVDDTEYPLSNNAVTLSNVTSAKNIVVTFDAVNTDPSVSVTTAVSKGDVKAGKDGTNYNTYIVYSDITNYGNIVGYGMKLTTASGETKDLAAGFTAEKTALQLLADGNGKFAFRVYGEVVDTEKCTLTPYFTTAEGTQYCEQSSAEFGMEPVAE